MRCIASLCALAVSAASAQSTWVWSASVPGKQSLASDALEVDGRTFIASVHYPGILGELPGESRLSQLEATGEVLSTLPIAPALLSVEAYFLTHDRLTGKLFVGGGCDTDAGKGVFALLANQQGAVLNTMVRAYPGMIHTVAQNGLALSAGGLLIGGGGLEMPGVFINRILLAQVDADGHLVRDTVYGTSENMAACRQIVEWNGDAWFVIEGDGLSEFTGSGLNRAFRLNEDLGVQEWLHMPYLDQSPPLDSVPQDALDLVPISNRRFASSGRLGGTWSPPRARSSVLIIDASGSLIRYFLPRSSFIQDFPPFLQGLAANGAGQLYFAVHENGQAAPPSLFSVFEPNRIHVYKLDTSLNVLCEHILDGFAENAYYYLNRIKATDDGGFLLLGGRRDFNDPSGYFAAWARKFGPEDCVVGIAEQPHAQQAVVFPNPGTEGFSLLLNGEARNGTLLVMDALGRHVGSAPIKQSQARFDARELAPGAYLYRAVDAQGAVQAVGRWVKE